MRNDLFEKLVTEPRLAAYSDAQRMKIGRLVRLIERCGKNGRVRMRLATFLRNVTTGPLRWAALSRNLVADEVIVLHAAEEGVIDITVAVWLLSEQTPTPETPQHRSADYSTPRVQRYREGRNGASETQNGTHYAMRNETQNETVNETPETVHETPSDLDLNQIRSDLDCLYIQTESDPIQI